MKTVQYYPQHHRDVEEWNIKADAAASADCCMIQQLFLGLRIEYRHLLRQTAQGAVGGETDATGGTNADHGGSPPEG